MLKILGLVFVSLLVGIFFVGLDYFLPGTFLIGFMGGEFIQTYAAVFGFSIAAIIFLLGQLMAVDPGGKDNFAKTKKEIKDNALFMLISFSLTIFLFIIRPDYQAQSTFKVNAFYYGVDVVVLGLFVMALYAVFEILNAAFVLTRKV